MKIETLKSLIILELEKESSSNPNSKALVEKINWIFELFEKDKEESFIPKMGMKISDPNQFPTNLCDSGPEEVPYHEICSCNPANGGSGICGCVTGNMLVPKNNRNNFFTTTVSSYTPHLTSDESDNFKTSCEISK
jgi:hypothetical protein